MNKSKNVQIGWYILKEGEHRHEMGFENAGWSVDHFCQPGEHRQERGFANAGWSVNHWCQPGRYPIIVDEVEDAGMIYGSTFCHWGIETVIESDDFQPMFCGNRVGSYDSLQNAGKESVLYERDYAYSIARRAAEGDENIELFPNVRITEETWTSDYDGEERTSYGLSLAEHEWVVTCINIVTSDTSMAGPYLADTKEQAKAMFDREWNLDGSAAWEVDEIWNEEDAEREMQA